MPEPTPHIPSWELPAAPQQPQKSDDGQQYLPLGTTLRLYAGWLLAWYMLVYVLGSFQQSGVAPWVPEFVGNLYSSPLTLYFTCATFLFLCIGTLHRSLGGGVLKGVAFTLLGCALLYGFWMYS